tara:strand:+ start:2531 stop:3064 length:534 start_codon:yes stop_codon:yes gene_type:complete
MSIYSGSSPFAKGKLSGDKLGKPGVTRGTGKRKSAKIKRKRTTNRLRLQGTTTSTAKGVGFSVITGANSSRLQSIISQNLTSEAVDGLGLRAATSRNHLTIQVQTGSDFASSGAAIDGLKNKRAVLDVDGEVFEGFVTTTVTSGLGSLIRRYRLEFPDKTSLLTAGSSIKLDLEFSS